MNTEEFLKLPLERRKACWGPLDNKKPGSVQWAWQLVTGLVSDYHRLEISAPAFERALAEVIEHRAWELIPPDEPYGSLEAMCLAEFNASYQSVIKQLDTAKAAIAQAHVAVPQPTKAEAGAMGGRGNKKATDDVRSFGGPEAYGNDPTYLTRRIARDAPEVLERMKAGDFPSVRAAAKAAGIVKDKTPLEKMQAAWRKATEDERQAIVEWIAAQF